MYIPKLYIEGDFQSAQLLPKVECMDITQELLIFRSNQKRFFTEDLNKKENISKIETKYDDSLSENLGSVANTLSLPKKHYDFEIVSANQIQVPLCKCKYFSVKVYLKSLRFEQFPVHEKIELQVLIYTQDQVLITKNTKGQNILKGNFLQNMNYFVMENTHMAYFRIQITEVSSHFLGKTVNIIIKPSKSEFLRRKGWKIRPFQLLDVPIKAKEIKVKV